MKELNVWIVTSEFPPMFGGGISTYCWEAGLAWSLCGHNVKVFTRSAPEQTKTTVEQAREKFNVVRVPILADKHLHASLGYWHLMSYCIAGEIIRTIRSSGVNPDMIEVQDYGALGYYLLKKKLDGAPELSNVKIVVYSHTPVFELSRINQESTHLFPNYWIGQCEKFCYRAADAVISPSNFLKQNILKYTPHEIDLIPYPFFGNTNAEIDSQEKIEPEWDCVYVGRLEYRKGVLQLLASFKKIWDSGKNFRLRMVGGDTLWAPKQISMRSHIEKIYSKYIASGVLTLSSPVPPDKLHAVFLSGNIVIVPSIYENFPYVCMQAMDLARPVLVSSSGGQAEMVGDDNTCGAVFNWDEEGDFEEKLLDLLLKTSDELILLGKCARKRLNGLCGFEKFVEKRINHLKCINAIPENNLRHYPFALEAPFSNSIEKQIQEPIAIVNGRLSIVIPFYNLGEFLLETIKSIEASDFPDKELVVVNDGSTETSSIDALRNIKINYKHIRILEIENSGLANARNVGAVAATGEFISFLDADDCVDPTYYTKCIKLLNKYDNISFVYSWVKYFGEADGVWVNFDTEFPYLLAGNMLAAFQVIRRRDYLNFGVNDCEMMFGMEDYEAWLRMVGHGKLGISIPETLVFYRVRHDSMARQFKRNTVLHMYEQMVLKNKSLYEKYGSELFMLINANGPGYLWNNPSLTYHNLGYVGAGEITHMSKEQSLEELSIGEIMRLKKIVHHPIISRFIRLALSLKIDKWLKC